jgi:peptide/nickel transport system ATP-binding protein
VPQFDLSQPAYEIYGGQVELNGIELPIWNSEAMDKFRFRDISIIPQYAMNAMNPIRKIGLMTRELLEAKGVNYHNNLAEIKHRLDVVNLSHDVLDMYPIELSVA